MCRHMWITNFDECTCNVPDSAWVGEHTMRTVVFSRFFYCCSRDIMQFILRCDYSEPLLVWWSYHLWPHTVVFKPPQPFLFVCPKSFSMRIEKYEKKTMRFSCHIEFFSYWIEMSSNGVHKFESKFFVYRKRIPSLYIEISLLSNTNSYIFQF